MAEAFTSDRNLPKSAQPWAAEVERRLKAVEDAAGEADRSRGVLSTTVASWAPIIAQVPEVQAAASTAVATAPAALSAANTANVWSPRRPLNEQDPDTLEGPDEPVNENATWYVFQDAVTNIVEVWRWRAPTYEIDETTGLVDGDGYWYQQKWGTDTIGDGAVGEAQLQPSLSDRIDSMQATANQASAGVAEALAVAEANVPPVIAETAPISPVEGQIWYPTDADGRITGVKVWASGSWLDRPLVADQVIVPGSAGTVLLADGAVTAPKIVASEELWAKLAEFAQVTTDMLVAGQATITSDLIADTISGKTLRGGVVSLLDQSTSTSSAVGYWKDHLTQGTSADEFGTSAGWKYTTVDSSGFTATVTSGDDDGTTVTGSLFDFISTTMPVGPVAAVGPITVSMTFTASWSVAEDTSGSFSAKHGPGFTVKTQQGHSYSASPSSVTAGVAYTLSATIPEGEWISQDSTAILVYWGNGGAKVGSTLKVSNANVVWAPALSTGLKIWRDGTGLARIDIASSDGQAKLSSSGVEFYDSAGMTLGSVSWRNFVAPPIGMRSLVGNQNIPTSSWTTAVISGTGSVSKASGGMEYNLTSNFWAVPITGFYRVTGRAKFSSNTTGRRAVGISINGASPDTNTFSNPTTGTFSMEVNDLVYLAAGDKVQLQLFQESGVTLVSTSRSLSLQFVSAT